MNLNRCILSLLLFAILIVGLWPSLSLAQDEATPPEEETPAMTAEQTDYMAELQQQWAAYNASAEGSEEQRNAYFTLMLLLDPENPCAPSPASCVAADGTTYDAIKTSLAGAPPNEIVDGLQSAYDGAYKSCSVSSLRAIEAICGLIGNNSSSACGNFNDDFWTELEERDECKHVGCTTDRFMQDYKPPEGQNTHLTSMISAFTDTNSVGGMLMETADTVEKSLRSATQKIFRAITENTTYRVTVSAAMTLAVIFYAVGFMFGLVELSGAEAVTRLIRIAIIVTLLSSAGWDFFNTTISRLFIDGADEVTNTVSKVGTCIAIMDGDRAECEAREAASPIAMTDSPLAAVAALIDKVLSMKMLVIMIALAWVGVTGVMGIVFAVIIGVGVGIFLWGALSAIWVYLVALVFKMLLLSLAPIFFIFILFDRTRGLFLGWFKQLVSFSLQPIFVFMFVAFFLTLISSYVDSIMDVELCLGNTPDLFVGTPLGELPIYRFLEKTADYPGTDADVWEEFTGDWGSDAPIAIIDALMFLLLAMLMWSFVSLAASLGNAVANGGVMVGQMGGMLSKLGTQVFDWGKSMTMGKLPGIGGLFKGGGG